MVMFDVERTNSHTLVGLNRPVYLCVQALTAKPRIFGHGC